MSITKILLVDDLKLTIEIAKSALINSGAAIITAADGTAALTIAKKEKPDLILLDINMPTMNGLQMLERLKKHQDLKDIPVIMITVICEPQDIAFPRLYLDSIASSLSPPAIARDPSPAFQF